MTEFFVEPSAEDEAVGVQRAELRSLARRADAGGCISRVGEGPWDGLRRGTHRIVDHFMDEDRCYAVLQIGFDANPHMIRHAEWLERVVREGNQKGVALDLCIAPSTLATALKQHLEALGISGQPSKMPLALVLLVYATECARQGAVWRQSSYERAGVTCHVVSWTRPDSAIRAQLSPAETCVVKLVIEGHSHAEIASRRHTSPRTVANQLASAFRRLKVSGRLELCRYLVAHAPTAAHAG